MCCRIDEKNVWNIIDLHKCTKNHNHNTCSSLDRVWTKFLPILGHFCPFYPICGPKNQNFLKLKKLPEDIIILHMCTKNYDHTIFSSLVTECDGRTDGQKKWHIQVDVPPKNYSLIKKLSEIYLKTIHCFPYLH